LCFTEIVLPKKNKKNKKKNAVEVVAVNTSDSDSKASVEEIESLEDIGLSKKQRRRKEAKSKLLSQSEPKIEPVADIETTSGAEIGEQNEPTAEPTVQKSKGKRSKAAKQAKKTGGKVYMEPVDAEGVVS
jgi:hypothetical protein